MLLAKVQYIYGLKNSTSIIQCIICMCKHTTVKNSDFMQDTHSRLNIIYHVKLAVACQVHVMYEYELKIYFCALLLPFPVRPAEYCGC